MRGYNAPLSNLLPTLFLFILQGISTVLLATRGYSVPDSLMERPVYEGPENSGAYYAPRCVTPQQVHVTSITQNSLRLAWTPDPNAVRFEVCIIKRASRMPLIPIEVSSNAGSYLFSGLLPNTQYDTYIRRICPGADPQTTYMSEWVVVESKTGNYIPSDCGKDTTLFGIGQVFTSSFKLTMSPRRKLNANGRRLMVRYRLTSTNTNNFLSADAFKWQQKLIYDENDLTINRLTPAGSYEFFIKQLRDGEYMQSNWACPEIGPIQVTLSDEQEACSKLNYVVPVCIGTDFVTLKFDTPAQGYDSLRYLIGVRPVMDSSTNAWKFYYHFKGEEFILPNLTSQTEYKVSVWLLLGKSGFSYDYVCGEYLVGSEAGTIVTAAVGEIEDDDGDGLPNSCDTNWEDGPDGDLDGDGIKNSEDEEIPGNFPQLPDLQCGQAANIPPLDSAHWLAQADSGQVFLINGFPILLTAVSGSNGVFSGEGIIGLPFKSKYLSVDFHNIHVNHNGVIVSGVVNGVSENINNFPDLPLDTITFGDERFCRPPPESEGRDENGIWVTTGSPYDPLGFDKDENFKKPPYEGWEPGDPYDEKYDPNGFDANGIHKDTKSLYNECGCSQTGFTQDGQKCDPGAVVDADGKKCASHEQGAYYWLNDDKTLHPQTEEGIRLANEVGDTLRPLVLAYLNVLEAHYLDSIAQTQVRCNTERDTVRKYYEGLGYQQDDRAFVYGKNDDWYREGMSSAFKEAPKELGIVLDRDIKEVMLEKSHIRLYHCDVTFSRYKALLDLVKQYKTDPRLGSAVDHFKSLIRRFNAEDAAFYSNIANLRTWIAGMTDSLVEAQYKKSTSTGYRNTEHIESEGWANSNYHPSQNGNGSPSKYLATTNTGSGYEHVLLQQASQIRWQDIAFEYHQGWQKVNGLERAYFLEAIDKAREAKYLVSPPPPGAPVVSLLPLKISREVLGRTYSLYLDNMRFYAGGAKADVYVIISTNPSPDRLVFKALNVSFGPAGFTGQTKLLLGTNVSVTVSNAAKINILGNDSTYVNFDCDGFKGMKVDGEVEFCRHYVVPLDEHLQPYPSDSAVKARFLAQMPAWGEFIAQLQIQRFALAQYDSIKWQVGTVVFDFSSSASSASVVFPNNYTSPFVQNINGIMVASDLWRGFYLNHLSVTMPRQFSKGNASAVTVGANHFIFDDKGLTGRVFANGNLISLCEGNLGGWAFSIDTIGLEVVANRPKGFNISGYLNVPIFSKGNQACAEMDECVRYRANILPGNVYSFAVRPHTEYTAEVWKAKVNLNHSEITLQYSNGQFLAVAALSGELTIDGDLSSSFKAKVPKITFQNLIIRNKAPYFEPGFWSVPAISAQGGMGGFDFNVDSIRMVKPLGSPGDQANLVFKAGIIIGDESVNNLALKGGFFLKGKMKVVGSRQRWVYDGFGVDEVIIDAGFKGVPRVHGRLRFFGQQGDDPKWGKGFQGGVKVEFEALKAELNAVGLFGKKGDYKYFMIDALAKFSPGIGIGGLQLIGFGGGASYHLSRADEPVGLPPTIPNTSPDSVAIGTSLSGITFTPNKAIGLGINANVVMALAKEEACNINATFGMSFYTGNGGINDIYFRGTANFMDKVNFTAIPRWDSLGLPEVSSANVTAFASISYKFKERILDGNLRVSVDAGGMLKGNGYAKLYFSPEKWFINIGTPIAPIYVALYAPALNLKKPTAQVSFYLDIGNGIPDFPGLPPKMASLTGLGNIVANEAMRRRGNGFATGLRFEVNTGEKRFLIFYASLGLDLGFDLMVQDYGDALCINTNKPLGINGWYASGQMWAYVEGKVGLQVKLWGNERKFEVLSLAAAAALQAKFPNPFFARGAVGGRYRILGGLIKGDCRFDFTLGEQCQLQGGNDPNNDQQIIADISPADSTESVHTLTIPTVTLNVPVGQELNDGTDNWRAELDYAEITQNGAIIGSDRVFTSGNTVLELRPANMLLSNKWYKFKVKLSLYKNGTWKQAEERIAAFKTGATPNIIPVDNVQTAWPFNGQYNFYKNEHPEGRGHIVLKYGQPELLQGPLPVGHTRIVRLSRMSPGGGIVAEFPFVYDAAKKKVDFDLPEDKLQGGWVYKLELVHKSTSSSSAAPGLDPGDGAGGPAVAPVLYRMYFRVSNYNRFADKVEALKTNLTVSNNSFGWMVANSTLAEPLDYFELYGPDGDEPLVQTTLDLKQCNWFNQNLKYLRLAFNYYHDYREINYCSLGGFYDSANKFNEENFSLSPISFEESPGNPVLKLSPTGAKPAYTGVVSQSLNFTTLNSFGPMWNKMRQDLMNHKSMRCQGQNYGAPCGGFGPLCPQGNPGCSNCTNEAAYGVESPLYFIVGNNMPLPQSNAAFPVAFTYRIPGWTGPTTSKTILIIKP